MQNLARHATNFNPALVPLVLAFTEPVLIFCPLSTGVGKRFPDGPCSAGYYCPPGQTTATPPSFPCPQGFYCPEGSPQPRACENGTFQPHKAKGFCELCPKGFYCETLGSGELLGNRGLTEGAPETPDVLTSQSLPALSFAPQEFVHRIRLS